MMTLLSTQDGLATLIALGAVAILLRRVLGFAKSSAESPCAHCSAAPPAKKRSSGAQPAGSNTTVFPLTLVRTDGTQRTSSAPGARAGSRS